MIKPVNYSLEFEPNLRNFTFNGKEAIEIKISKPTKIISLNASELKIKKCHIIWQGRTIKATSKTDEKNELLTIHLSQKINDSAQLYLEFIGILNDRLLGFYKSEYKDARGKKKYLATTQFEAADARRAFSCWDEPEAKATFDISIITDNNLTAVSNMPVISKKKIGGRYRYKFSRTPIMSTYLIYLGVGEFEFLTSKLGKILVRIVTTKGNKSKGKLALDFTKKIRYVDIIGVLENLYLYLPPIFFFDITGMLEIAVRLLSVIILISNVAFASGSSQHGNARLASAASN